MDRNTCIERQKIHNQIVFDKTLRRFLRIPSVAQVSLH